MNFIKLEVPHKKKHTLMFTSFGYKKYNVFLIKGIKSTFFITLIFLEKQVFFEDLLISGNFFKKSDSIFSFSF